MNETELEKLVVRIVGDAKQFLDAMEKSRQGAEKAADAVGKAGDKVEGFTHHIEGFGQALERAMATIGIGVGFKEAFEEFDKYEKNVIRLNAVLEANERDVKATTAEYTKFAKEIANTTTASKGQVMALLEASETYGLTWAAAEKAAKEALAASKIVKSADAESLMRFSAQIAKGDLDRAQAMSRMIPQLRGVTNETELLEKWQKLVAAGTKVLGEELNTAGGQIEKAKKRMEGFTREIGGVIAEGLEPATKWLGSMAERFSKLSPETKSSAAEVVAITAALVALNAALPLVSGQVGNLAKHWRGMVLTAGVAFIYEAGKGLYSLTEQAEKAEAALTKTRNQLEKINTEVGSGKGAFEAAAARMRELTRMIQESRERSADKPWWKKSYGEMFGEGSEETRAIAAAIAKLRENMNSALKEQTEHGKNYGSTILYVTDAIGGLAKQYMALPKDIADFNNSLRTQIETLGMTSEEVDLYKLKLHGATEEELKDARASIKVLEERRKALEQSKELSKEAATIHEKYLDPHEKFLNQQKKLLAMVFSLQITWKDYARAIEDAKKQMQQLAAAERDAAEGGSAEAVARIQKYMDAMGGPQAMVEIAKGAAKGGAGAVNAGAARGSADEPLFGGRDAGAVKVLQDISRKLDGLQGPGIKVVKVSPGF